MDFYNLDRTDAIILLCIIQCALGVAVAFLYLCREIKAIWNWFTPVQPNIHGPEDKISTTTAKTDELTITREQLTAWHQTDPLRVCKLRRYC